MAKELSKLQPFLVEVPADIFKKKLVSPLSGQVVGKGMGKPWLMGGLRVRKIGRGKLF
jgi:hypothetical protein